jgi:aryl-alcohol dehydrogenase-like predicted oxidoreductase
MRYRFLGKTGVRISELCFGTMSFGGDADEKMAKKLFSSCRDAGINCFDCADVYAGGRSEEILGKLIKTERDELVIASKAYFPTSQDVNARGATRFHLVRAVEASLRRLKTDRIDVYFLHRFDDETSLEGTLRALEDLVRQGKILYPAASNFAAWQVARAIGHQERWGFEPFCCIQPMYNLVKRQAEVEILPFAESEGLAVLPYSPLGGGLLTGKYGISRRPKEGRLVQSKMYETRYAESRYFETAERFCELAREVGVAPAPLAIAWVAAHPAVTAPLIGARDVEQLAPLLASVDVELDSALYAKIGELSPTPAPATDRNEEKTEHNFGAR